MPNQLHGCKFTLWVTTMLELNACSMIHMFLGIHFLNKRKEYGYLWQTIIFHTHTSTNGAFRLHKWYKILSKIQLWKSNLRLVEHTKSWYTRNRSFTTSSVSSGLVISFDSHCGGGSSGGMYIRGPPFSPSISMEATLKFPPHWLHILLPRHFASRASSRSLRLITKSISVTPSSIS